MKGIEDIALAFDGVTNAYAIQAGKEVRVVVSHEQVDDVLLNQLATDICKKIETTIEFPGQIKVCVIRQSVASKFTDEFDGTKIDDEKEEIIEQ